MNSDWRKRDEGFGVHSPQGAGRRSNYSSASSRTHWSAAGSRSTTSQSYGNTRGWPSPPPRSHYRPNQHHAPRNDSEYHGVNRQTQPTSYSQAANSPKIASPEVRANTSWKAFRASADRSQGSSSTRTVDQEMPSSNTYNADPDDVWSIDDGKMEPMYGATMQSASQHQGNSSDVSWSPQLQSSQPDPVKLQAAGWDYASTTEPQQSSATSLTEQQRELYPPKNEREYTYEYYFINNTSNISCEDIGIRRVYKHKQKQYDDKNPFMYPNFLCPSPVQNGTQDTSSSHSRRSQENHKQSFSDATSFKGHGGNASRGWKENRTSYRKDASQERPLGNQASSPRSYPNKGKFLHNDEINPKMSQFPQSMDVAEAEAQLANGQLYGGVLRINRRSRQDAYVTCEELDSDIFIHSEQSRNRAFEGDFVAVRLVDVDTAWKHKMDYDRKRAAREGREPKQDKDENYAANKPKYAGEVVCVLDRPRTPEYVGYLEFSGPDWDRKDEETEDDEGFLVQREETVSTPSVFVLFRPLDKRAPFIKLWRKHLPFEILADEESFKKKLVVVQMTSWHITQKIPNGKVLRILGRVGDLHVESEAILHQNGIKDTPFSKVAVTNLPPEDWVVPSSEFTTRRDLRHIISFTVDPPDAKDLDDALYIEKISENKFEVGVHIADVSYFVRRDTSLDTEARDRGSTTYLVDRTVPMLPSVLSENLCSLNPNLERLAFSVIWRMDKEGNIEHTWIGKTIIQSSAKLSYDEAQGVIDSTTELSEAKIRQPDMRGEIEKRILDLHSIAQHLRKRRFNTGALALNSVKLTVTLDDMGEPTGVDIYRGQAAQQMIEEFMLLANTTVAEMIVKQFPESALLRRHEPPLEKKLGTFISTTAGLGYKFDTSSAGNLHASFEKLPSGETKDALLALAIRPMQRANYFCTGSVDISKFSHYALNQPVYTHFTSPIRRYADIVVHRQLTAAINGEDRALYSKKAVQYIAARCNYWKERTQAAQEASIDLYLARYLSKEEQKNGPVLRTATVLDVSTDTINIYCSDYGLERRIYLEDLPLKQFKFDNAEAAVVLTWTRGEVVDLEQQTRRRLLGSNKPTLSEEDYSDDTDTNNLRVSGEQQDQSGANEEIVEIPEQVLHPCKLEAESCRQFLDVFSQISVRIQINNERSPPEIVMYPVNPFP